MRRLPLTGLLTLLLLLAVVAAPAAAQSVAFGASVEGYFTAYARGSWTWSEVTSSLAGLRAAGATVGRAGADWSATEPRRPVHGRARFDWSYDDTIVRGLASARLRWQPTLDYTPAWARQRIAPAVAGTLVSPLPPVSDAVYAVYAAAFARRYGVGGTFWRLTPDLPAEPVTTFEIWNEPDCRWTWGPRVDLQDYAALYAAAYRAIKREDRRATVITGGLAFTRSSLPRLLGALRDLPVDGIALHPYARTARGTVAAVRWAETELVAQGRGRTPLFIDEYGWTSAADRWQSVSTRVLHADVRAAIVGLSRIPHVRAVIPFEWADPSWGLSDGTLAAAIRLARRS
jgi:hypothetical protein